MSRTETDSLGSLEIPDNAYWGIHTQRALDNFPISGYKVPSGLIASIAIVKKACCMANSDLGYLGQDLAGLIIRACDEIESGELADQFPVDALQGGAGTSTNMNVNEVIANRSLELMGIEKGRYDALHPIEHINLHQSTNDVYPTALKIAAIYGFRRLSQAAASLQGALQVKEKQFADILIVGRTELQDAVPITLGGQFASFAEAIARDRWRTFKCEERLRTVNIGGTAVGTGLTAPQDYIFLVIEKLRQVTGLGLTRAEQTMDATANTDPFVEVSGMLSACATNIIKIASDLRLMHYFGEIRLPAVQAGSSIMPGKVNPVVAEATITSGLKVLANDRLIADCASRGSFQINEFIPLIAFALLESLDVLTNTCKMLANHVEGIEADAENCRHRFDTSEMIITAFLPYIGYKKAETLLEDYRAGSSENLKAFLEDRLGAEIVCKILSPQSLMSLGYKKLHTKEQDGKDS